MEPDEKYEEPAHPGTMNRADRRIRGFRVPRPPFHVALAAGRRTSVDLHWQFQSQRDKDRRTPRVDGVPRRWAVEKFRRQAGLRESVGIADEMQLVVSA